MLRRGVLVILVLGCMLTAVARGEEPAAVVAALGAKDYATRQAMTRKLMANETLGDEQIRAMFQAAENLEQEQRLLVVAEHHFLRGLARSLSQPGQAGAMGVATGPVRGGTGPAQHAAGLRVIRTLPGFQAHEVIHEGDVIVSLNGRALPVDEYSALHLVLRESVTARRVGAKFDVGLVRMGETITVTVTLGSMDALDSLYNQDPEDGHATLAPPYDQQWETRRDALLNLAPKPGQTLRLAPPEPDRP